MISHTRQARDMAEAIVFYSPPDRPVIDTSFSLGNPASEAGWARCEQWYADEAPGDWVDEWVETSMSQGDTFRESAYRAAQEPSFAGLL